MSKIIPKRDLAILSDIALVIHYSPFEIDPFISPVSKNRYHNPYVQMKNLSSQIHKSSVVALSKPTQISPSNSITMNHTQSLKSEEHVDSKYAHNQHNPSTLTNLSSRCALQDSTLYSNNMNNSQITQSLSVADSKLPETFSEDDLYDQPFEMDAANAAYLCDFLTAPPKKFSKPVAKPVSTSKTQNVPEILFSERKNKQYSPRNKKRTLPIEEIKIDSTPYGWPKFDENFNIPEDPMPDLTQELNDLTINLFKNKEKKAKNQFLDYRVLTPEEVEIREKILHNLAQEEDEDISDSEYVSDDDIDTTCGLYYKQYTPKPQSAMDPSLVPLYKKITASPELRESILASAPKYIDENIKNKGRKSAPLKPISQRQHTYNPNHYVPSGASSKGKEVPIPEPLKAPLLTPDERRTLSRGMRRKLKWARKTGTSLAFEDAPQPKAADLYKSVFKSYEKIHDAHMTQLIKRRKMLDDLKQKLDEMEAKTPLNDFTPVTRKPRRSDRTMSAQMKRTITTIHEIPPKKRRNTQDDLHTLAEVSVQVNQIHPASVQVQASALAQTLRTLPPTSNVQVRNIINQIPIMTLPATEPMLPPPPPPPPTAPFHQTNHPFSGLVMPDHLKMVGGRKNYMQYRPVLQLRSSEKVAPGTLQKLIDSKYKVFMKMKLVPKDTADPGLSAWTSEWTPTFSTEELEEKKGMKAQMFHISNLFSAPKRIEEQIGGAREDLQAATIAANNAAQEVSTLRKILEGVLGTEKADVLNNIFGLLLCAFNATQASTILDTCLIILQQAVTMGIIKVGSIIERVHKALVEAFTYITDGTFTHELATGFAQALGVISAFLIIPLVLVYISKQLGYGVEKEEEMQAQMFKETRLLAWAKLAGGCKTIASTIQYFGNFLWWVVSWCFYKVTGRPLLVDGGKEFVQSAQTWMEQVHQKARTCEINASLPISEALAYKQLALQGETISEQLTGLGYTPGNFTGFFKTYEVMKTIGAVCDAHLASANQRFVPLCVELVGGPSVGKSTCSKLFGPPIMNFYDIAILGMDRPRDWTANQWYVRDPMDEYWSNYNSPFAVVFDDWLQIADPQIRTAIADQVRACVNNTTLPLRQNLNEKKGTVFFDSPFVILTSNTLGKLPDGALKLQNMEAFNGRIDFVIQVNIKAEYVKVNPNDKRDCIKQDDDRPLIDPDVYTFTLLDSSTRDILRVGLEYEEVVKLLCGRLLKKSKIGRDIFSYVKLKPDKAWCDSIKAQSKASPISTHINEVLIERFITKLNDPIKMAHCRRAWKAAQQTMDLNYPRIWKISNLGTMHYWCNICHIVNHGSPLGPEKAGDIYNLNVPQGLLPLLDKYRIDAIKERSNLVKEHLTTGIPQDIVLKWMDVTGGTKQEFELYIKNDVCFNYGYEDLTLEDLKELNARWDERDRRLGDFTEIHGIPEPEEKKSSGMCAQMWSGSGEDPKIPKPKGEMKAQGKTKNHKVLTPPPPVDVETEIIVEGNHTTIKAAPTAPPLVDPFEFTDEEDMDDLIDKIMTHERLMDAVADKTVFNLSESDRLKFVVFKKLDKGGYIARFVKCVKDTTASLLEFLKAHPYWTALFGTVTLGGTALLVINMYYASQGKLEAQWGTGASQGEITASGKKRVARIDKFLRAQSQNSASLAHSIAIKNSAIISCKDFSSLSAQKCTFFHANCFHTSAHFIRECRDKYKDGFTIYNSRHPEGKFFNWKDCNITYSGNDLSVVRINSEQPYPSIIDKYIQRRELEFIDFSRLISIKPSSFASSNPPRYEHAIELVQNSHYRPHAQYSLDQKYGTVWLQNKCLIEYIKPCQAGDCGELVILDNDECESKIVAEHVGGTKDMGVAQIVFRESLQEALVSLDAQIMEAQMKTEEVPSFEYTHWEFVRKMDPKLVPPMPGKTEIIRAPWIGLLQEPTKYPAKLRPFVNKEGVEISPVNVAVKAMQRPPRPHLDERIVEMLNELDAQRPISFPLRKIPIDQTINGDPYSRFIKRISMKTSCGFLGLPPKDSKKTQHLLGEEHQRTWSPHVERLYQELHYKCLHEIELPEVIATMFPKDELRPIEKVLAGKTRLVSGLPLHHLIASKRYFGAHVENCGRYPLEYNCAMGLDPNSWDWHRIYSHVREMGLDQEFAGDIAKYDGSEIEQLQINEVKQINKDYERYDPDWDEDDDLLRQKIEACGSSHCRLLIGSDVVDPKEFGTTGRYLTFYMNSRTCRKKIMYSLVKILERKNFVVNADFLRKNTYSIHAGDDFLLWLRRAWGITWKDLQEEMAKIGQEMTPPDKNALDIDSDEVGANEFMKRTPHVEMVGGVPITFARLPIETVLEIPNWIKKNSLPHVAWTELTTACLRELLSWGKDIYEAARYEINDYARMKSLTPFYLTWEDLVLECYGIKAPREMKAQMHKQSLKVEVVEDVKTPTKVTHTSKANEFYHTYGEAPSYTYKRFGPDHLPMWMCTASYGGYTSVPAEASVKTEARDLAISDLLLQMRSGPPNNNYFKKELRAQMIKADIQDPAQTVDVIDSQLTTLDNQTATETIALPQTLFPRVDPFPDQGLGPILSRLYKIDEVLWSYSATKGTLLWSTNFPGTLFNKSPILLDKATGFEYFRANTRLIVQSNGTMSHCGLAMLSYLPTNNSISNSTPHWKLKDAHTASTCKPKLISATGNQSTEIIIPNCLPNYYLRQDSWLLPNAYFGSAAIHVLSPLVLDDSAAGGITLTIWAAFDSPEIAGPLVTTFSPLTDRSNQIRKHDKLQMRAQMKNEAVKKSERGVLSGIAEDAGWLAQRFAIATVAFPPVAAGLAVGSVLANAGGAILRKYGLNKPISEESTCPIYSLTASGMADGEGLTQRHKLNLQRHLTLANSPSSFGSTFTPETIAAIAKIPVWIDTYAFDAGALAAEEVICVYPLTPFLCHVETQTIGLQTIYNEFNSPAGFVARNYRLWRGVAKDYFRIIVSKFVSGRIRFTYFPVSSLAPAPGQVIGNGVGDMNTRVYDFNGETEIPVSHPFLHENMWLETTDPARVFNGENLDKVGYGSIVVSVAVPPVFTSTTTTNYVNIVHFQAWEEFRVVQLKAPDGGYWRVVEAGAPDLETLHKRCKGDRNMKAQSMKAPVIENDLERLFANPFPSMIPAKQQEPYNFDSGENIEDIYSCMHRMTGFGLKAAGLNTQNATFVDPYAEIMADPYNFSFMKQMLYYFMYWRGSFDINLQPFGTNGTEGNLYVSLVQPTSATTYQKPWPDTPAPSPYTGANGVIVENLDLRKGMQFNLPYFSKHAFQETQPLVTPAGGPSAFLMWMEATAETSVIFRTFISASDNFSMGWAVGTPVTTISTTVYPPVLNEKENNSGSPRFATGSKRDSLPKNNSIFKPAGLDTKL